MAPDKFKTIIFLLPALILISISTQESAAVSDPFALVSDIAPAVETECSFGVSWNDYDNDSFPDLFVTRWWSSGTHLNALYHNNGDGTFNKITDLVPVQEGNALGAIWGDYDNDGDEDLFTARFAPNPSGTNNRLYRNVGNGGFSKITEGPVATDIAWGVHATFADFDNDGDLDLLAGNHIISGSGEPYYYRNEAGDFVRVPPSESGLIAGDCGAIAAADVDSDGDLDIVHARNMLTSRFFMNDGEGTFTPVSNVVSTDSTRCYCWGDYDNDGDFDLCGMNRWSEGPVLYRNDGVGGFDRFVPGLGDEELSDADGKPYWADYDNDGDLDLLVVNQGSAYAPMPSVLFANNGDGTFTRLTNSIIVTDSGSSSGAAWADYDRDGDLDLYVARTNFGHGAFFRNDIGSANSWISIRCMGTKANRSGIGAKVRVKARIGGADVWQLRQISGQSGFFGQDEMRAHFGLGDAATVDSIRIEWPGGMVDVRSNVAVNQFLIITEAVCGDSNGNGLFNIQDVTYSINALYKGGLPSEPLYAADANGDFKVNIQDITYMINALYKGGPEPKCLMG